MGQRCQEPIPDCGTVSDKKETGYFSSGLLGLPRCRIVDSKPSHAARALLLVTSPIAH